VKTGAAIFAPTQNEFGGRVVFHSEKSLFLSAQMKNARRLPHAFSLALTALLLVVSVWSRQGAASPLPVAPKAGTEKEAHSPQDAPHATLQELSPMATAPSVVLTFAQEFTLVPPALFVFEAARRQVPSLAAPPLRLAYLEVLFEHFIVVNAP
jgi:hypothetical protein